MPRTFLVPWRSLRLLSTCLTLMLGARSAHAQPTARIERVLCTACVTCPGDLALYVAYTTGSVVTYEWEMTGSGGTDPPTQDFGSFAYFEHRYPGTNTVKVKVTDTIGHTANASLGVTVNKPVAVVFGGNMGHQSFIYNAKGAYWSNKIVDRASSMLEAEGWEVDIVRQPTLDDIEVALRATCAQGLYFHGHGASTDDADTRDGLGLSYISGVYTSPVEWTPPEDVAQAVALSGAVLRHATINACKQNHLEWEALLGVPVVGPKYPTADGSAAGAWEFDALAEGQGIWPAVPPPVGNVPAATLRGAGATAVACTPDTIGGYWYEMTAVDSPFDPYEVRSAAAVCASASASPVHLASPDGTWALDAYFDVAMSDSVRVVGVCYRNVPWGPPPGSTWNFLAVEARGSAGGGPPDSVVVRLSYSEAELAALGIPSESVLSGIWFGTDDEEPPYLEPITRLDTVLNSATFTIPHGGVVHLAPIGQPVAAVPPPRGELGFRLTAAPNPFSSELRAQLVLERPGRIHAAILDVGGRSVRLLRDDAGVAGTNPILWNGQDDDGRQVSDGVYFLSVEALGRRATRKVVYASDRRARAGTR